MFETCHCRFLTHEPLPPCSSSSARLPQPPWNGPANPALLCKHEEHHQHKAGLPMGHSCWTQHSLGLPPEPGTAHVRASCRIPFPFAALSSRQGGLVRPFLPGQIHSVLGTQLTRVLNHTQFGACPLQWSWQVFYCCRCHHLCRSPEFLLTEGAAVLFAALMSLWPCQVLIQVMSLHSLFLYPRSLPVCFFGFFFLCAA